MSGTVDPESHYRALRQRMVVEQLTTRGIQDAAVLEAFRRVPRHRFVPERLRGLAYDDGPLTIGHGQTISQPLMVAEMLERLRVRPGHRVLDVGTGSGYQAALLAEMGARVIGIERHPELARAAEARLAELGYDVTVHVGDGTLGLPSEAPFDRIIVAAGAPAVPPALVEQLAVPGRLVLPVGPRSLQTLHIVERRADGSVAERHGGGCAFVPLIGRDGWHEGE